MLVSLVRFQSSAPFINFARWGPFRFPTSLRARAFGPPLRPQALSHLHSVGPLSIPHLAARSGLRPSLAAAGAFSPSRSSLRSPATTSELRPGKRADDRRLSRRSMACHAKADGPRLRFCSDPPLFDRRRRFESLEVTVGPGPDAAPRARD